MNEMEKAIADRMNQVHALAIDDDVKNLGVLTKLLSIEGVTSTSVFNLKQLEAVLQNIGRVDVIFLDLEMPDIDGYRVFERLKSDTLFQSVPVVAYSVHVSEINTVRQLGFHSFLGKPIDGDRFPDQLARILGNEPVWETM
jgi:CheY-like chemotaxis protein